MDKAEKIAAIIGITEAIKQYGIPSKYCPTIAIAIGAMLSYVEQPNAQGILEGIVWGASITGGYAVVKHSGQGVLGTAKNQTDALEPDDDRGV